MRLFKLFVLLDVPQCESFSGTGARLPVQQAVQLACDQHHRHQEEIMVDRPSRQRLCTFATFH